MKRCWLLLLVLWAGIAGVSAQTAPKPAPKVVDFSADVMRPVKVGDSSVLSLVGHVVFYHNGAVIVCDSAIRFNDRMMDCYNNVIINKDDTFIYGDKAEYNGNVNTARVFAPLVKVVDQDATLYTYNFSFNTLDNIGHYTGGGTMLQKENRMESKEGYYYADNREMTGVQDVEMSNPDYKLKSDSVSYNLDTELARFYTRSYIWNKDDEFLTAKRGAYDRKDEKYTFTDDSYILTKTQEVWADTIVYYQGSQDAQLFNNAQVADDEQQAVAFGDYIQYWGKEQKALLTREPVVASFQEGENHQRDTLYMRADSMFVYTIHRDSLLKDSLQVDSLVDVDGEADVLAENEAPGAARPAAVARAEKTPRAADGTTPKEGKEAPEGLPAEVSEDVKKDSVEKSQPTEKELKRIAAEQKREARDSVFRAKANERDLREKEREAAFQQKLEQKKLKKLRAKHPELAEAYADSLAKVKEQALLQRQRDSLSKLAKQPADSLIAADSVAVVAQGDSLLRKMFAYHNVKLYRTDFQAVCDSMTGFSLDSTLHMYIKPVLWNQDNQVTSEVVDIFTRNQKIDRALFTGEPIMSQQVDTSHFNQIKGKEIESFFRDGAIYRTDVNGNGQTYYYMVEGDSTDRYISGFMTVECADITFYFNDQQVDEIVWRGKPAYSIFPMDKIPNDQPMMLKGFSWQGDRRPSKEQVFQREFRPSQRAEYSEMAKPLFPITEKINTAREQLVKAGVWLDRNDPLTLEAVEFIRSLGY